MRKTQAWHDGESFLNPPDDRRPYSSLAEDLNTSEFNDVKGRLLALHNHRKIDDKDLNKPKLHRAPGSGTGPVDVDEDGKKPKGEDDERPTLKRRPDASPN